MEIKFVKNNVFEDLLKENYICDLWMDGCPSKEREIFFPKLTKNKGDYSYSTSIISKSL